MDNGARVSTPQLLVDSVLHLISLPEIYLRLQETIDDPLHSREQIAEIVAYDPALSARVLRIANSSYYGFPREIETVGSAVGLIGELELRNLVLATTVIGAMTALDYKGVDVDEFWLHSLRCTIVARLLARSVGDCDPEILFVAGICTISVYSSSINRKRHWLLKSGVKLTNSISFAIRQSGKYWASTTPRLVRC